MDITEQLKMMNDESGLNMAAASEIMQLRSEIKRLREVNKKLQQDYYDCMEKLEYIHSMGKDRCE